MLTFDFVLLVLGCSLFALFLHLIGLAVLKSVKIFIVENFEEQLTKHHFYPHLNNKQEGNNNKKTQSKKKEARLQCFELEFAFLHLILVTWNDSTAAIICRFFPESNDCWCGSKTTTKQYLRKHLYPKKPDQKISLP